MSLKIYLDRSEGAPITTNEPVTGHIELHLKKAEQKDAINQILLTFYGRSKVRIEKSEQSANGTSQSTYYDSKALLFSDHYRLDNATFSPPASRRGEDGGILTFPFSFQVPEYAEPLTEPVIKEHNAHIFRPTGPFPATLGHDPPGSFQVPPRLPDTVPELYARFDSHFSATASVRYTLHAECPELKAGASRLWQGNVDEQVDLPISNPTTSLPAQPVQWKRLAHEDAVRSLRLLPSHQDGRLTFRENMRSFFKKDRLPWCRFRMTIQMPDLLWLDRPDDQPLPILLNVRRVACGTGAERRKSDAGSTSTTDQPLSPTLEKAGLRNGADEKKASLVDPEEEDMPTPPLYLKAVQLSYVSYTALRGADERINKNGGKTWNMLQTATFCDWEETDKKQRRVEVPVGPDTWFDLGSNLGITWGTWKTVCQSSKFGGMQGEFRLANLIRSFGMEWDIKMEGADAELRWETRSKYGGGIRTRVLRGDGESLATKDGGQHQRSHSQGLAPPPMPYPDRGSTPVDPRMQYSPQPSPAGSPKPLPATPDRSGGGGWEDKEEAPPGYSRYDEGSSSKSEGPSGLGLGKY